MSHTPGPVFISKEQVRKLNEKHGWFEFRDAQSNVSNDFANEAIERYERIRSAAPELLEALQMLVDEAHPMLYQHRKAKALAAIAKATGEQA